MTKINKSILIFNTIVGLLLMSVFLSGCTNTSKTDPIQDMIEAQCGNMPYPCGELLSCEGKIITFKTNIKGTSNIFSEDSRILVGTNTTSSWQVNINNTNNEFFAKLQFAAENNAQIEITAKIKSFNAATNGQCQKGIIFLADASNIKFE